MSFSLAWELMLVFYLAIMVGIGWFFSKRIRNFTDYFLAGRNLGLGLATVSFLSGWIGAATVMGFTGYVYKGGYSMIWIAIPTSLGVYSFAFLLSRRISRLRQFTLPDVLEMRYGKVARLVGAFFIVVYMLGMCAMNFMAGGRILQVVTGIDYVLGMVVCAAVVVFYTLMGGLSAVVWTDLFQWIWVTVGLAMAGPIVLGKVGGWSALHEKVGSIQPFMLDPMALFDVKGILSLFLVFTLPFMLEPGWYQRCFAARDERTARLGVTFVGLWDAGLTFLSIIIAFGAMILFGPDIQGDLAFPLIVKETIPGAIGGFILVTLIAATTSSADTDLLLAAGTIGHDYYKSLVPKASDRSVVAVTKVSVAVLAVISLIIAARFEYIMDVAIFSFTVFVSGAFLPVVMAFYCRRANEYGAIASMAGGGGMAILWKALGEPAGLDPIIPGFAISVVLFFLVSLSTPPPKPEKVQPFVACGHPAIEGK